MIYSIVYVNSDCTCDKKIVQEGRTCEQVCEWVVEYEKWNGNMKGDTYG